MTNTFVGGVGVETVGDSRTFVGSFGTFVNVNTFDAAACAVNVVTSVLGEFESVLARAIVTAAKVVADGAVVTWLDHHALVNVETRSHQINVAVGAFAFERTDGIDAGFGDFITIVSEDVVDAFVHVGTVDSVAFVAQMASTVEPARIIFAIGHGVTRVGQTFVNILAGVIVVAVDKARFALVVRTVFLGHTGQIVQRFSEEAVLANAGSLAIATSRLFQRVDFVLIYIYFLVLI